ncbi:MAG: nucleotidyltransferase domain-containing protein [bacterium]
MISTETIQQAVRRVVVATRPTKVTLFGSYARVEADKKSDLDLMVIEPHVENVGEEMTRVRAAVGDVGAGVDVLVYPEEEFERRSQVPGTVLYWARQEGQVLYDASA